jgi:guanylate kinase
MQKGLLIVVSGPSGAGKGTLCKGLFSRCKDLAYSISTTTRHPREGEVDGENYYFVDRSTFETMLKNGDLLEWAMVYDNYYGTPKTPVLEKLDQGIDVVLEIDIQGAMKVKQQYNDGVFIFVLPPSMDELKKRIENRGTETRQDMKKRLDSAWNELKYVTEYDYAVVNDEIEPAINKLQSIITAEKCRIKRNLEWLNILDGGDVK